MHGKRMLGTALAATVICVSTAAAQPADTTRISQKPLFTSRDAIAAGAFALGTLAMYPADKYFAEELQDPSRQTNRFLHHQATNVRLVAEYSLFIGTGMYVVGRLGRIERMADLGLHGTEAVGIGLGIVSITKGLVGRARPYVDTSGFNPHDFHPGRGYTHEEYRSFPSGHTVMAFSAAAAVSAETSRWWPGSRWIIGPAMYGGATLVGISRMYNNKHWASDVVTGAAIGTFSGLKVVRYHHSHPGNRIDKWLLGASISPSPDGGTRVALSLVPR